MKGPQQHNNEQLQLLCDDRVLQKGFLIQLASFSRAGCCSQL